MKSRGLRPARQFKCRGSTRSRTAIQIGARPRTRPPESMAGPPRHHEARRSSLTKPSSPRYGGRRRKATASWQRRRASRRPSARRSRGARHRTEHSATIGHRPPRCPHIRSTAGATASRCRGLRASSTPAAAGIASGRTSPCSMTMLTAHLPAIPRRSIPPSVGRMAPRRRRPHRQHSVHCGFQYLR